MKYLTFAEFYALDVFKQKEYLLAVFTAEELKPIAVDMLQLGRSQAETKVTAAIICRLNLAQYYHAHTQQPFKPELITELFEGWNKDDDVYEHGDIFIDYDCNADGLNMCFSGISVVSIPRTLDEFISDCKRAGIELEAKGKVK